MKSTIINVICFAAGAAVGSLVAWKMLEVKHEKIIQEEIKSIREALGGEQTENEDEEEGDPDTGTTNSSRQINWEELEDLDEEEEDEDETEEESNIARVEYERLAGKYSNEKGGAETVAKKPYVIAPYDFGTFDDYHQIELTYYADGILEDAEGNIIDDADELVGEGSLYTFGEYEDDAVHVRNERLETDFEILKEYRTYSEVRGSPNQVRDE